MKKWIVSGFSALVLAMVPLAADPGGGIDWNRACASEGEGCCFNPLAICDIGGQPQHQFENKSLIQVIFGCGGGS